MSDDLVKRLRDWSEYDEGKIKDAREEAADRIEELEAAQYATEYAGRLASTLAEKHYKDKYGFELLPSLLGRIDQIDNMTCGMIRIGTQGSCDAPSAALAGEKKDERSD
jgi:hypothetical protein